MADTIESPKTFTLITPLQGVDGETISALTFEEPTYIEQVKLAEDTQKVGAQRAFLMLMAKQCGQSEAVLYKLRARDSKRIEGYISGFFEESPETPGT